ATPTRSTRTLAHLTRSRSYPASAELPSSEARVRWVANRPHTDTGDAQDAQDAQDADDAKDAGNAHAADRAGADRAAAAGAGARRRVLRRGRAAAWFAGRGLVAEGLAGSFVRAERAADRVDDIAQRYLVQLLHQHAVSSRLRPLAPAREPDAL